MINNNFKAFLKALLLGNGNKGVIPIKLPNGNNAYLAPYFNNNNIFPYASSSELSISSYIGYRGVFIGSGGTPATENDYTLESFISSGITSTAAVAQGVDVNNNPYKRIVYTLNNTTNSDITIREIGMAVSCYVSGAVMGATSMDYVLIDRTVLETPLTVPANGTAVLVYELKTIIS